MLDLVRKKIKDSQDTNNTEFNYNSNLTNPKYPIYWLNEVDLNSSFTKSNPGLFNPETNILSPKFTLKTLKSPRLSSQGVGYKRFRNKKNLKIFPQRSFSVYRSLYSEKFSYQMLNVLNTGELEEFDAFNTPIRQSGEFSPKSMRSYSFDGYILINTSNDNKYNEMNGTHIRKIRKSLSFSADTRHTSTATATSGNDAYLSAILNEHSLYSLNKISRIKSENFDHSIDLEKNSSVYLNAKSHLSFLSDVRHSEVFSDFRSLSELPIQSSKEVENVEKKSDLDPQITSNKDLSMPKSTYEHSIQSDITTSKPLSSDHDSVDSGSEYNLYDALSMPIHEIKSTNKIGSVINQPNLSTTSMSYPNVDSSKKSTKSSKSSIFSFKMAFFKSKKAYKTSSGKVHFDNSSKFKIVDGNAPITSQPNNGSFKYLKNISKSSFQASKYLPGSNTTPLSSLNDIPSSLKSVNLSLKNNQPTSCSSCSSIRNSSSNIYQTCDKCGNKPAYNHTPLSISKKTFPKLTPKSPISRSNRFSSRKRISRYASNSSLDSISEESDSNSINPTRRSVDFIDFIIKETAKERKKSGMQLLSFSEFANLERSGSHLSKNIKESNDVFDPYSISRNIVFDLASTSSNPHENFPIEDIKLKFVPISMFMKNYPTEPTIETFLTTGVDFKVYNSTIIFNRSIISLEKAQKEYNLAPFSFPKLLISDVYKKSVDIQDEDGSRKNSDISPIPSSSPKPTNALFKGTMKSYIPKVNTLSTSSTITSVPTNYKVSLDSKPKSSTDIKLNEASISNRKTLIENLSKIDKKLKTIKLAHLNSLPPIDMDFFNVENSVPLHHKTTPVTRNKNRIKSVKSMDYLNQVKKTNRKIKLTLMSKNTIRELRKENLMLPPMSKSISSNKNSDSKSFYEEHSRIKQAQQNLQSTPARKFSVKKETHPFPNSIPSTFVNPKTVSVVTNTKIPRKKMYSRSLSQNSNILKEPIKMLEAKKWKYQRNSYNVPAVRNSLANNFKRSINPDSIITIKGSLNSNHKLFRTPSTIIKEVDSQTYPPIGAST
ncbi:hypothetical protein AYI70_g9712 [Smittium culicis]|uniref:Uncharacterized protein n=1 Tax=Smittium culicis TaxID=133412 RepID=A0A1R1XA05_9FUNG|nr:hypothetical protein AYI70_g9712 [Smittium culicis]